MSEPRDKHELLTEAAVNAIKLMAFTEAESINSETAKETNRPLAIVSDTAMAMTILAYASCGLAKACGLTWEEFLPTLEWTWGRITTGVVTTSKGGDA
jgi:hypothetical protein